jgi:hypothetical protein
VILWNEVDSYAASFDVLSRLVSLVFQVPCNTAGILSIWKYPPEIKLFSFPYKQTHDTI